VVTEDYGKLKLGQLRERINAGDDEAAAYVAKKFEPLQEQFKRMTRPLANIKPESLNFELPAIEAIDTSEMTRQMQEIGRQRAADRRAAIAREQAMVEGIATLKVFAEDSARREIDADARARVAEGRERRMFHIGITSCIFTAVATVAAIVALVA
jgi:hypothetical protein